MKNYKIKIYQLAEKTENKWPKEIKRGVKKYWQSTIKDDKYGLISALPLNLWRDCKNKDKQDLNTIYKSGLANLYFWTAANIQDDLSDEENTPKECLPLANACLITAQNISWKKEIKDSQLYSDILLKVEEANFKELTRPQVIPKSDLEASHKSLFLLLSSLLLIKSWQWSQKDRDSFLLAGKYFLAAKQIADDVYDFKDDWQDNRRTFAHRRLKSLPQGQKLSLYYQAQSKKIISLCQKCRQNMKKISALKNGDCFDDYLDILEKNCARAFTN
jgi:hypothetical protein